MMESGWVDEVRGLLLQGYSADLPTMSAIGYREIIQYLQGEITYEEAVILIKRNTRTFVRRQANWFKPDDYRITWFVSTKNLIKDMEATLRRCLHE